MPVYGSSKTTDVQTFLADGTWIKPAGAKAVRVWMFSGGGGGGSGMRGAPGGSRCGGNGGGGGACIYFTFPASVLGATETVTVGVGGVGGAAITTDATVGNPGTAGTSS